MRRRPLALLLLAGSLLIAPAIPGQPEETGAILLPGSSLDRTIGTGETHVYRIEVGEDPVVVLVEQQSIDLVLEVQDPQGETFGVAAGNVRWGPEVLLVEGAGQHRIEVRPKKKGVWPGRYTIRLDSAGDGARRQALSLMSRAGRQAFAATPEARGQSAASYREALTAWRALGDDRWEAEAMSCLAGVEQQADEFRPAIADHERALVLWQKLAVPEREAATLNELGLTRVKSGEVASAREDLTSARSLWKQLKERFDEAETHTNLCYLEQTAGNLPTARDCYAEPRAVFREVGAQDEESRIANNLGGIFNLLGEPDAALDHYQQAFALGRALNDPLGQAWALNNIGVIHRSLGEWQEALRVYGQAREILAPLGERFQEAFVLNNIGSTYASLGEPQRALAFLEDALRLRQEVGDGRGESMTRVILGITWRKLGDSKQALDHYRKAIELSVALGDTRQAALIRSRLGEVHLAEGDPVAALRELAPALVSLRESGMRTGEAQVLQLQGQAQTLAGRPSEALPLLKEALALYRTLRDRAGEAGTLHALAVAERSLGLFDQARGHAEEAVANAEELRIGFVSPDLRAAYLATQRRAYSLLIDLHMDRHSADPGGKWDRAAFAVSEQARARSLLDALGSASAAGRDASAVPADLLERRRSLRRRLSAKADQQVKQSGAKVEALKQEIETLLAELDNVDAQISRQDPHYAAFSKPQPMAPEEIARLLDPGTVLLEYALGEERSFLWVVGTGGLRSFVLPSRKEIEDLARRVYEDLSTVSAGAARGDENETLSRLLLKPAWKELAGVERLVVVPDAALHVLPFSALLVPEPGQGWETPIRQPLLESFQVVDLPSATTLALQRRRLEQRPRASERAVVLADPVFAPDDPRLAHPAKAAPSPQAAADDVLPAFERLPASGREAEVIAGLAPKGEVRTVLDLSASRETVLSGELRAYRIVHFATHAVADTANPELSGLVLSLVDAAGKPREGFLGLSDIYELDLAADLVVLSGCRTGFGREVRGEGLMGLTRGFFYAGVPRVVASLWPVQDRATHELMSNFYQAMWRDGLSPAAALRQAQRSMRGKHPYRNPYSWAGFVLQGDWR